MSVALELAAEASEWAAVCRLVRSDRCNRFAVGRALLLAAKAGELDTAANICEAAEPVFADKVVLDLRRAKKLQLGFSATHRRLNDKAVTYNVNTTLIQAAENGEWNLVKKMFMVADRIASVIQATKVAIRIKRWDVVHAASFKRSPMQSIFWPPLLLEATNCNWGTNASTCWSGFRKMSRPRCVMNWG
ncbi:hypothetical protein L914_14200 [Phytophthora nicotianae]|uniref:Uncharacterized protein n=1 Tax=Phytophthora nicotianae TaxID=4792 RepID=W2MTN0_PHYNI|nr:hypothetical protein L914_14200 [Phytophthora nicotianae]